MKAIVLTWDRHRVITEHMMRQYARLWPDHPFTFRVPYQRLAGANESRTEFIAAPADIPGTVLRLLEDLPDEEWVYWCADDKYPIELRTKEIGAIFLQANGSPDISGLLCCRCRVTLDEPELSLFPGQRQLPGGETLLERRLWYQIWIHQFLRVKVLRYFFTHMPPNIPNAKVMDELKNQIPKPDELRLYVTASNYSVFGESTQRGRITQNCFQSIKRMGLPLPEWFRQTNGSHVTMGELKRHPFGRWKG